MTGAREDDRQYFKKQTNRQDYYYNRKNSFGTITPYSTVPLNSSTIASSHNSITALPSLKPALEHTPVNNFNAREVSDFLNNKKPELYKSTERAWGSRNGLVWGQKGHLMANGNDFFDELRKSSFSQVSNGQPSISKQIERS
ncbi:4849_t:CDS:2 [Funneliformis geosporum]|uniref:7257_t:CDS:1 n=1 Tax=Funneliformis geosporum TaxID=1117311 RepID=A0A9W4WQE7_9GLOM|nr:7257_t:CDS:2 [Funneliformis geosporum]CAI2164724.1 4849_t:CDS:2 [Funneliformis geosporum]